MAFGDYLKENIHLLEHASLNKADNDAFWEILKRMAVEDILAIYPDKIDSDVAVPIYYEILNTYESFLPQHFCEKLNSNNQERYRVINRNLWTSNAFHPDGLANQIQIKAYKEINEEKKGDRIVYQGVKEYVIK